MTQTNTEYLLQVTTPVTDRTYGATSPSEGIAKFDDHLSQASTYSSDDSRNFSSGSQRTDATRYERDDRSWNGSAYKPSGHDNGNSTPSQSSPSVHDTSSDQVCRSTPSSDKADGDEHDSDKSDDTTAAEVAGASQAAKDNSPKSGSKSEAKANTDTPETAKTAAVSKKAAAEAGERKTAGVPNGQATSGSSPEALKKQADETSQLAVNATTDVAKTDEGVEPQATTSDGKQWKAVKGDASTAKETKAIGASKDGAVRDEQSVNGAGTGEIASAVAKKAGEKVEASATLAGVNSPKGKSDTDEASDDDSRAGARNDATVSTNKVDAAQLAGSIPNTTDAAGNASSKGKDNEQATKPIAAKGEPVAAAFARMARNNVAGSLDSESGANDLPQVDPSRFIGRVAKAFQTAQDRGGTLQLRLSPPELGALHIELSVKDGVMSASLQTENASARRLLLDHLPALRDRLAEQNIRVDRFDVDVRGEGTGGQTDARGSQQQQFQHQPDQPAPRRPMQPQPRPQDTAAPESTSIAPNVSDAGLNLII